MPAIIALKIRASAIPFLVMPSGRMRFLVRCRPSLPWDYFRVVRDRSAIEGKRQLDLAKPRRLDRVECTMPEQTNRGLSLG